MSMYRKRKINEKNKYNNLFIEHQRFLHYEELLIRKIEKIEEKYESRLDSNKMLFYISILIPILGYTNDVIGMKIIMNIPNYKEIIVNIVLLLPSTALLISVLKVKKSMKRLNIYAMKSEYSQNIVFYKYLIEKIKEDRNLYKRINDLVNRDSGFNTKIFEYYLKLNTKDKIVFEKSDLENFIYEYLKGLDKNILGEIDNYLCEIIISRHMINGHLRKGDRAEKFIFSIDRRNALSISTLSNEK